MTILKSDDLSKKNTKKEMISFTKSYLNIIKINVIHFEGLPKLIMTFQLEAIPSSRVDEYPCQNYNDPLELVIVHELLLSALQNHYMQFSKSIANHYQISTKLKLSTLKITSTTTFDTHAITF